MVEKFHGCMILLLFAGKLLRLYRNSKHLIITKKKFAGNLSRLEANPRKPQKFSTVNDLHYTVSCSKEHKINWNTVVYSYTSLFILGSTIAFSWLKASANCQVTVSHDAGQILNKVKHNFKLCIPLHTSHVGL